MIKNWETTVNQVLNLTSQKEGKVLIEIHLTILENQRRDMIHAINLINQMAKN